MTIYKNRYTTPEHEEYRGKAIEALHRSVDKIAELIYLFDGEGVFDDKIDALYQQAHGLHDIIDGDPVGTYSQREHPKPEPAANDDDPPPF